MHSANEATGGSLAIPPEHRAEDLIQGGTMAWIRLGHQLYTLRVTRAGKLILTK